MKGKYQVYLIIGHVGQWSGLMLNALGLVSLILLKVDLGTILLVSGSLTFTIVTKIKYYAKHKIDALKARRRQRSFKVTNF